jgi:hypothetical protein
MALKLRPNISKLCTHLEAMNMLWDVFSFPESDTIANAYDEQINQTIQLIQAKCRSGDFTLPLSEVRILFVVYYHLGLLCQDLAGREESSEWEKEQAGYLNRWKYLCSSKDYPQEVQSVFTEYSDMDVKHFPEVLDSVGLKKDCLAPAYIIYWHLCYLCDRLPSGPEKEKWETKRSAYLASNSMKEKYERESAVAYAMQVKVAFEEYDTCQRGMDVEKYYNDHLASDKIRQRRAKKLMAVRDWLKKEYKY